MPLVVSDRMDRTVLEGGGKGEERKGERERMRKIGNFVFSASTV